MTQGKSAIGGQSGTQNMHYNTPPATIGNQVPDGSQFILLVKNRQSDEFQVWTSGDETQARDLFSQARRQVDQLTNA